MRPLLWLLFCAFCVYPISAYAVSPPVGWPISYGYGGSGSASVTSVPEPPEQLVAIDCGGYHTLGIRPDGSLVAWGRNNCAQSDVPEGNDFVDISGGGYHSVALRSDGSIVAWADFSEEPSFDRGQLDVPEDNDFIDVAATRYGAFAMKSDGTIVGWGDVRHGMQSDIPTGSYTYLSAGLYEGIVIDAEGNMTCWGWSDYGQTDVPEGKYKAGVGGRFHTLAIREDGSLAAWGNPPEDLHDNNYQMGQTICPEGNDYIAVAAGEYFSLAMHADGTIVGWGENVWGGPPRWADVPPDKSFMAMDAGSFFLSTLVAVPEPSTATLALCCAIGCSLLLPRRRLLVSTR